MAEVLVQPDHDVERPTEAGGATVRLPRRRRLTISTSIRKWRSRLVARPCRLNDAYFVVAAESIVDQSDPNCAPFQNERVP
jgi:hypothetical protein